MNDEMVNVKNSIARKKQDLSSIELVESQLRSEKNDITLKIEKLKVAF